MRIRHLLLAALALAFLTPTALAQDLTADRSVDRATELTADEVPARFTYSGLLTTSDGAVVADGPRALVFRGYASAEAARAGGAPDWEETHQAAVVGGRFLSVLGSQADVPGAVRYLTISVDGEAASAPVALSRGAGAEGEFAPGNTLQDSYDNGRVITVVPGSPMQIRGAAGDLGLTIRDITPVFISDQLMRFRLRSVQGGRTWEYRVYGTGSTRPAGTFAITDATGGGADGFIMAPGVGEDVMTLTGNTVQLGSPDNPADLSAYTTSTGGGPGTGLVNYQMYDYFGFGASSRWLTEDGNAHTRIEPDLSGDGGFFTVARGAGGLALTVDGNVGGGSQTRIGSGANSSFFNDTVTGNNSVVLPGSSVSVAEIFNEAGAANAFNSGPVALNPSAFTATLVRSITVPTSGYVIAMGVGELSVNHLAGATDSFQMSVSRDCSTPLAPGSQQGNWQVPSVLPTATYRDIKSAQGLFSVGAGTTTFCNVVTVGGSAGTFIDDQQLTLLFVPTQYGAIQTNLVEDGSEERQEAAQEGLSSGDIAAERASAVQANQARVAAELAALRARMDELEASMSNNER